MTSIRTEALPPGALLCRYRDSGAYTDCFVAELPGNISHGAYVEAFYTSWVFRLERWVLAVLLARPSTDAQVRALAAGTSHDFAAWRVEDRSSNQLLLCDYRDRTRSWLMVTPMPGAGTRLYFGSAVVPQGNKASSGLLLALHKLYSRILLRTACRRLPPPGSSR